MSDQIQALMDRYDNYDINSEGDPSIYSLRYAPFEAADDTIQSTDELVLVLIEPRLLDPLNNSAFSADDLLNRLAQFKSDLVNAGYRNRFIMAHVYSGTRHQDGRTLLAVRRFFQEVADTYKSFRGVILVGSFPEAMLVRRWIWRQENATVTIKGTSYTNINFLSIVPEIISERAELVLADLSGRWDQIYHEGPEALESIVALPHVSIGDRWPRDDTRFVSTNFEITNPVFQDFFWIKDDNYKHVFASVEGPELQLDISTEQAHPELSDLDRTSPNPVARPDIFVSRINARHIAVNPPPEFLAPDGLPQTVESAVYVDLFTLWRRDPALERRILIDYFDRNHRFRTGGYAHFAFRTAAIAFPRTDNFIAANLNAYLRTGSAVSPSDVIADNASLLDYLKWLTEPALLKGIQAHSSPWNTVFGDSAGTAIEMSIGGRPWNWIGSGTTYSPALPAMMNQADQYIYRTIWENHVLEDAGANFFIHAGCQVNSPQGASMLPYIHPAYGDWQNAENVLFFLNGVALISRAKVFNDLPSGFPTRLHQLGGNVGYAWRQGFDDEALNAGLNILREYAACKRCYTWSVLGDWTLGLHDGRRAVQIVPLMEMLLDGQWLRDPYTGIPIPIPTPLDWCPACSVVLVSDGAVRGIYANELGTVKLVLINGGELRAFDTNGDESTPSIMAEMNKDFGEFGKYSGFKQILAEAGEVRGLVLDENYQVVALVGGKGPLPFGEKMESLATL